MKNKIVITVLVESDKSMDIQTYLLLVSQALKISGIVINLVAWDTSLSKEEIETLIK